MALVVFGFSEVVSSPLEMQFLSFDLIIDL